MGAYELDNRYLHAVELRESAQSGEEFTRARARELVFRRKLEERDFSQERRSKLADQGKALPDGSYPIATREDLQNAVQAVGRAPEGKRGRVKAHIVKRAKALGATDALPDEWQIQEAKDSMAKASTPEPFSSSRTSNWVARVGGLPDYVQHIAHDLMEKRGKSESQAIQMAIGIVKRWARGGGNVDSNTRAAAAKAVAEWEAKKAANAAKKAA